MDEQDAIAIGIAAATATWLAWRLWNRIQKPSCGPPLNGPQGADGFVSVDSLVATKKSGRPEGRPDR